MSAQRHSARRLLLQALYQMQLAGHAAEELERQFAEHPDAGRADQPYFSRLLGVVAAQQAQLDADIATFGDIPPAQLDPVEHAVLWIALAECRQCPDVPAKVIINEAVELAKTYGAEGGYKFVNGVLDKALSELR